MSAVLGIILIIVVGPYLVSRIAHARNAAWAGPRSPGMRGRGGSGKAMRQPGKAAAKAAKSAGSVVTHPGSRQIRAQAKADAYVAWQQAFATDHLEQQRHGRANGTVPAAGVTAPGTTATATRPTLRQRLRLVPFVAQPASPASGGSNGAGQQNGTGTQPGVQTGSAPKSPPSNGTQPANGSGGPPARPVPPPPATPSVPPSSNGGSTVTTPGTTAAGAEQFIEGVNQIHATAASGGINAKQAGIKSATEGCIRFGAMVIMLARQMSEAGRYGPEITEPLAKTAQHLQAAAMTLGEADTAITTLKHMQVGELAASARQAPHHDELNEAGNR